VSLIQIAFLMLSAGACGGVLFTILVALGVRYPAWFGAGHGLLGLAALGLLGYALLQTAAPTRGWWAFGVFTAGLLGGIGLFRMIFHDRRPIAAALLHGSVGLAGLFLLYPVAFAVSAP
jgi:hypothetical protein